MRKLWLITTALVATAAPAHADPISAAVAWVGSTLAAGGFAAFALNTALSIGLSAISGALLKPQKPAVGVEFNVSMGDNLPLSFIAGDYITAGKRKYIGSWGRNNRYITEVIEVSCLPQSGLAAMWVNDEPGAIQTGINDKDGTPYVLGNPLDNYKDEDYRIWVRWIAGTQTAADPMLVGLFGSDPDYPWTNNCIGRGKSYAIVTTRYDTDTLTSYPSYLLQPTPISFYDLRYDSTNGGSGTQRWGNPATWQPTRNPAVIAYNIIRGVYYGGEWVYGGKNLPAWRLPQAEWIAAANACDAPVAKSGGGTEPRYRCGLEITVDTEPASILEEIGKSANMRFAEVGGRIKAIVDLPGAAVLGITDGDILITEGQSFQPFYSVSDTFNTINATYPEPAEKWASKDAPQYIDADAKARQGDRHLPVEMSYPAVPYAAQVQRLMRSQMQEYGRQRRHDFYLPPDAYGLEPGVDMLSYTSDRNGYINKLFVVETVKRVPGMNVLVQTREVDPADYDWSSDFEQPVVITPPVNPVPFVQPISGLTATGTTILDQANKSRRPAILVTCDGDEVGVSHIQMEYRVSGQSQVMVDPSRAFAEPFAWHLMNVIPGQSYEVRARLLSDLTPKSQWSSWLTVLIPDVRLTLDDLEQDILDGVVTSQAWLDASGEVIADLQAEIDADVTAVDTRLTNETAALSAEVADARQLALDNLVTAKGYTDTAVTSETIARQTAQGQLSARLDEITAAGLSNNLLTNGDFSDGDTGWVGVTVADGAATLGSGAASQQFPAVFGPTEMLQWRVEYTGPVNRVRVQFKDDANAATGNDALTDLAIVQGSAIGSGQHAVPDGTTQIKWLISGAGAVIDNVAVTKIDQQVVARISSLETALATDQQALADYTTTANARFSSNEAAITTEGTSRANADTALSNRVATAEATVGTQGARITTAETTLANQAVAAAQLSTLVEAESGRLDLVRDGTFARGMEYWPDGALPASGRIIARDPASSDPRKNSVPADRYYTLSASDAGGTWRVSDYQAVTAGETIEIGFDYSRTANAVYPAVRVQFYGADMGALTVYEQRAPNSGGWQKTTGWVDAPAGAVYAKTLFGAGAGGSANAGITNISARRTGVGYASRSSVQVLQQVQDSDVAALAAYKVTANARLDTVEGRASSNATAISQTYTKAQTDNVVAAGINSYDVSLTDRLKGKANATALEATNSRVTQTEQGLAAEVDRINLYTARTDAGTASGMLRVNVMSSVAGVVSRVGLRAETEVDGAQRAAALILEARSDGSSSVGALADKFFLATDLNGGGRVVPFYTSNGVVYINTAHIQDLTVGTIKITNGAIHSVYTSSINYDGARPNGATVATINFAPFSTSSRLLVGVSGTLYVPGGTGYGQSEEGPAVQVSLVANGVTRPVFRSQAVPYVDNGSNRAFLSTTAYPTTFADFAAASGTNTVLVKLTANPGTPLNNNTTFSGTLAVWEAKR